MSIIQHANSLSFMVPLVPPSVNHYAKHTRSGKHYTTGEAEAFKDAVAIFCKHQYVVAKTFSVSIRITLGKKQRGDVDNFPKLVLDGLADAGVFRSKKEIVSDAHVKVLHVVIDEDSRPERGKTAITVEALR